ncbi:MAG: type II toxin-antitoxin system PemK/MazF family toxin [Boseongicola sp.]|nr:type II toxin-antitoxin system PemK/MazF family toxin [Boseongicola sp.]
MAVRSGELVTVAQPGDFGKPRPALIIQADQFADLGAVAILPITSTMVDAPLLRLTVAPSAENGLRMASQIMLDKPMTVRTDRTGPTIGQIDDTAMISVSRSLAIFPGLAG